MDFSFQTIRVFVSSTFRDMHAERDHLVKFVFPELRRLCESRGVTWGEVDLRWGVTDEQAAEGKVLPICLEEIRRCRPYFIGLLGERYGWIPDAIPPEVIEREPWLKEHLHHSVTELEILHGVLRDPKMAGQAFFYFRDPAYVHALPPEQRLDFVEEPTPEETARFGEVEAAWRADERRVNLMALKDRIRRMARDGEIRFPPRENYPNPKALGEMVLRDLTEVINKLYPEGSQPDPLDREAMDHEAYAQSRERVYIGRPEYFARLDAHADGAGDQPLAILGESGSGKSALLANWAARYRREYPDALVLQHYIGASPYSADWAAMLRRLMGEFKRRLGVQRDIPDNPDALRSAFPNWMHMASAACTPSPRAEEGRGERGTRPSRIVLILDALNQLEDPNGAPDLVWLPPVIPENVRLIVSTLPGRPLDEIRKRHWPTMEVKELESGERRELITKYLTQYAKNLSPARVERLATAPPAANPLYLCALLEEMRLCGEHERLEERITQYLRAGTVPELYEEILKRYEDDYEQDYPGLVQDATVVLCAARQGLSEAELLEILGDKARPLPRMVWSPLYLAMEQSLVNRSGLLGFSHEYFRQAVHRRYLAERVYERTAHQCLADYFNDRELSSRKIAELPWQLRQAENWRDLYELLTDLPFLTAAWHADHYTVKTHWAELERSSSYRLTQAYRPSRGGRTITTEQASTLAMLFLEMGHPDEALQLWDELIEFHRRSGDQSGLEVALGNKAFILHRRGDSEASLELMKEQQHLCKELGNDCHLATCLGNQADALGVLGRYGEAQQALQQQQLLLERIGDLKTLARSRALADELASLHNGQYKHAASWRDYEKATREQGDKEGLILSLESRSTFLLSQGEMSEASKLIDERERISREIEYKEGLMSVLGDRGEVARRTGDYAKAMSFYEEEEKLARELSIGIPLGSAKEHQAKVARDMGDIPRAMALYREEIQVFRQIGSYPAMLEPMNELAVLLIKQGSHKEAMALLAEQEGLSRETRDQKHLAAALGNQAFILQAKGDVKRALELLQGQEQLCRELQDSAQLWSSLHSQANLLRNELGDRAAALPKCQEAISLAQAAGNATQRNQSENLLKKIESRSSHRVSLAIMLILATGLLAGAIMLVRWNTWMWFFGIPMIAASLLLGGAAVFSMIREGTSK